MRYDDFMTVKEAAREVGLSPCTIRMFIYQGRICAIKRAGILFIERTEIEKIRYRRPVGRPRKDA